ncbi:uncharacterized protein LOC127287347 [Leptopilina boulardi]|uniref:uncharacterized protein LOC127287347 n=1 Tax=Leptopilina boulardi TaxID=63433 RepID=UPI0021F664FF|nr:uncharacterized protein LOC127287347 [Leptopilina boulardi]
MNPDQFNLLYNMIAHRLQKVSRRRPLSKKLRLIVTLKYLANGDSNRTTSNFFRIGHSTTYRIIIEVCNIIWECLSPIYLPRKDAFDWQVVARGFYQKWNFPNCVGAIDGKEIRIKKPPHSGTMYYNYKKFCSFKLLAACDAFYRFTWVDVGNYGSISDYAAFVRTDLSIALENNEVDLPPDGEIPGTNIVLPYCFIGDAIFPFRRYLMKPYDRNQRLNDIENNFNYRLARGRNTIEDSFGLWTNKWTNKWTIYKKKLEFKVDNSISIVLALVCLHNFIITQELLLDEVDRMYTQENEHRQNLLIDENNPNVQENVQIPDSVFQQRNMLAEYFISEEGILR